MTGWSICNETMCVAVVFPCCDTPLRGVPLEKRPSLNPDTTVPLPPSLTTPSSVVSPPEFCPASQLRPAPLSPPAYGPTSAFGAAQADGRRAGGGVGEGQSGAGHEWVDETVERKNLYVVVRSGWGSRGRGCAQGD